ncbi:DUF6882 domain-containing protein [Curtobacterium sp. MCBA15_001]|uniref:DUF6882 domain-containing protein n=1 Tax=Curtobacterium sp. MCBA15_001 TaxID=1898731 RepID=UPI0008DD55E9|nr:DUF6882 domain-containing protein [Curtobacterium sp. MCBA15_001]OIH95169.1 hypothetical protein BIU90_03275 [Curtobacterium sp. MCBA15_001]
MTRSRGLDALITDGVFLAHEAQLAMADRLGDHDHWDVDLAAGEFRITGPQPATFPVQLLGSAAPGPRSWLWGWGNPTQFAPQVLTAALTTRAFGEQHDVPELVQAEVPFGDGGPEAGYELGWSLSIAARLASGTWFSYSGEVGGGTRVWMLLEGMLFDPPSVPRMLRVFGEALQTIEVNDHRRAVGTWAQLRGVPWDGRTMTLSDGSLSVDFDDQGRIRDLRGSSARA